MDNRVIIDIIENLLYEPQREELTEDSYIAYVKTVIKELREEEMDRIVDERIKKFGLEGIV